MALYPTEKELNIRTEYFSSIYPNAHFLVMRLFNMINKDPSYCFVMLVSYLYLAFLQSHRRFVWTYTAPDDSLCQPVGCSLAPSCEGPNILYLHRKCILENKRLYMVKRLQRHMFDSSHFNPVIHKCHWSCALPYM